MALTRDDWLIEATEKLRIGGVDAVRVEVLARDLGVSKGSFYWHFRDRIELLDALLERWESETEWLIAGAGESRAGRSAIVRFFELAIISPYPPDRQIFAWARVDAEIAHRVHQVELRRIEFLARELMAAGLDSDAARTRAELLYTATLGWLERRWRGGDSKLSMSGIAELLADLFVSPGEAAPAASPPALTTEK
jgi:AcrR family transcriptional regulator